jgi:hypothetical protein
MPHPAAEMHADVIRKLHAEVGLTAKESTAVCNVASAVTATAAPLIALAGAALGSDEERRWLMLATVYATLLKATELVREEPAR